MQVMAQSLRVLHYLCTAVPDPAVAAAVAAGAVGKCVEFSRKNDAEAQPLSRELRVASVDVLCLLGRYEAALAHMAEPMSRVVESLADSETEVRHDREAKPGVSNLLEIFAVASGREIDDLVAEYGDQGYGTFKSAVAEAVVEMLRPVQERHAELADDPGEVMRILADGAQRARAISEPILQRAKDAVGFLEAGEATA